jgi:hypothetical protein
LIFFAPLGGGVNEENQFAKRGEVSSGKDMYKDYSQRRREIREEII